MEKIINLSPIPKEFLIEFFKMHGVVEIDVVDAGNFDAEQVIKEVKNAGYIIGDYRFQQKITREVVQAAKNVKLIQQPSVGYQHIDIAACSEVGIKVANTAGANTIAAAEHTIMSALCLIKNIVYAVRTTAAGEWRQMDVRPVELFNKTWGFIGFGRIGKAVAERLIAFGTHMLYYDVIRIPAEEEKRLQVTFATLSDVLKSADILSLHCPLTEETTGLINRDNIALMKPGAIVINVARGEVVDEQALAEALRDGKLGGAALDVFSAEPIASANPLLAVAGDKVILSPHVAGVSQEAQGRIITTTITNIVKVMKGEIPESLVN
jgi:phosphoglycerate dehydrogenase-like enzyme